MAIAMTLDRIGFQGAEGRPIRPFPERLTFTGGEAAGSADGYTPGEKGQDHAAADTSRILADSGGTNDGGKSLKPSLFKRFAFAVALSLAGLAILPSAFAAGPAKGAERPVDETAKERVVEGPDLQAFRDQAFQMTAHDVMGEVVKISQDLRSLDDSPGKYPGAQDGKESVDRIPGKGEISVATPQVITRSRSVSGTMSYDTATGEPRSISADVMTRIAGRRVTRHVEYSRNGKAATCSVSMDGITYRITADRGASLQESFQRMSAMDVISEVNSAAEQLQNLDDSTLQMLIEQNGAMGAAGSIDTLPGAGEVRLVSPHRLADGRTISGTYSYDGDTGRPKSLRAETSADSEQPPGARIVELSENEQGRIHRVTAGSITVEVQMDRIGEF